MERALPNDDRAPANVSSWHLWFSLTAGMVVWVIHLTAVYALTSLTCEWGWFPFQFGPLTGLQAVQTAITIVAGGVTIYAGILAVRSRRRLGTEEHPERNRHYFMAALGLALNIMFTALIALALVPILLLPQCG